MVRSGRMADTAIIDIEDGTDLPPSFRHVYDVWRSLPKSPDLPLASGFSLEFVPSKLLPWSVLVDVITDPLDFRFRFWGTERTNLIGAEMTGKMLSEIGNVSMREGNREEYIDVCRRGKAVLCRTPIVTRSGIEGARTSIRLPLSNDGRAVSRIFSAVDPDSIDDNHYAYYGTTPKRGI